MAKLPDQETLLSLYRALVTIRSFEEHCIELEGSGKPVHAGPVCIGQEAVPVGVCAHLTERDSVVGTHRDHGHSLAKGVDPKRVMAEIWGKITGTSKGKGGGMLIADFSKGMLGGNGVIGGSLPVAVGAALTAKLLKTDQVAVAFFGDGASNQGTFHESLNLASVWKLPVVFVCENNRYSETTPVEYSVPIANIADRAAGYGMPGVVADGQDVFDVYEKAGNAIGRARRGQGPTLLECKTYNYHPMPSYIQRFRTREEEEHYKSRDCIKRFKELVLEQELLTAGELELIDTEVKALIEEAARFGEESAYPPLEELYTDVFATPPKGGVE